jgi:hypothetical protein
LRFRACNKFSSVMFVFCCYHICEL